MARYELAPTLAAGLLRMARHRSALTQSQLAVRAGVPQQAISAYETGRREPTLPTLERLLAAAGLEMRIRLEPLSDHDKALEEYVKTLPPATRAALERRRGDRVATARSARRRGR